jgi:hypothetical protein
MINTNTAMDSTTQTSADDAFDIVGVYRGKEIIKKLVVQLKDKIKELGFEFCLLYL